MSLKWSDSFRHALALRLGIWYAALFIVSATALALFTYALLARALVLRDRQVLESTLARYVSEYRRSGLVGLTRLIQTDAGEGRHERLLIRVMSGGTQVVYFAEPAGWDTFDLSRLNRRAFSDSGLEQIPHPPDSSVLEVASVSLRNGVTIQVGRSSHVRDELLANFRARAFEVATIIALIAVAGGVLLTYAGLSPLRALEGTVRTIVRTGRFDARVETTPSRDPLGTLGGLINVMLGRIETLLAGMRGALDNVAHDLRTPLTRFRNVAEEALISGDPAALREGLGRALEEADRVNATLNALIDISEAETGTMRLAPEPVDVAQVAAEAVELYADEAEEKGIALRLGVASGTHLFADRTRLRQVLANLIENAVKYTDPGGRVDVEAVTDARSVTVTVRDTGVGISPEDAPFVWDRLYRADASRSARGLGLGLSLVKAIVEAHGGQVRLASMPDQGSAFCVVLPRERSS